MTTMISTSGITAYCGRPANRAVWSAYRRAPAARPATAAHLRQAAGMAMRLGLALVPFSALAAMFVWL